MGEWQDDLSYVIGLVMWGDVTGDRGRAMMISDDY